MLKRKRFQREDPPQYLEGPVHGSRGKFGGTSMTVVLGPSAADTTNYGSKTNAGSIPKLMRPLHDQDPDKWVAGHLLNDNLGGSGTDPVNLTPLTKTANRNHATHEGRIKAACERAKAHHNSHPDDEYWFGVRYTVDVSAASFGDFVPYNKAPSHIRLNARLVKQKKSTGVISNVANGEEPFKFTRITNEEIHNDDAHLQ